MIFEEDYRIAINVTSLQNGYLYILNEGPTPNGKTSLNILYPSPGRTALLAAGQVVRIPEREWFVFDRTAGEERLFLSWSLEPQPEFERVKDLTETATNGVVVIHEPDRVSALLDILARFRIADKDAQPDERVKKTLLSSDGNVLSHLIRLEHQ
jgi:hypothetical protein